MIPMMQRRLIVIAGAIVLVAAPARADLHRFSLAGQVVAGDSFRPATLHLLCEPDAKGGAISIELWVPEAATRKDFDYEDFEGPDAAASEQVLTHLSVTGGGAIVMGAKAGGWYAGEEPDTFVFAVTQPAHEEGGVSTVLEAVDPRDTKLAWVQTNLKDPTRELRATFALDPTSVKQIRDTVDPCLTIKTPAPAKP